MFRVGFIRFPGGLFLQGFRIYRETTGGEFRDWGLRAFIGGLGV